MAAHTAIAGLWALNWWTIDSGFTKAQYEQLVALLVDIEYDYLIPRRNVSGHDSVRWAAIQAGSQTRPKYDPSGRKNGLGNNFDWAYVFTLWNEQAQEKQERSREKI